MYIWYPSTLGILSNNFLHKCNRILVLSETSGQEMFSDVMLPKYGNIENRYPIFELASTYICISHLVGLFALYDILL